MIYKQKKDKLPDSLLNNNYFYEFVTNFLALLLSKITLLDFSNMGDFFSIFFISRNIEILIELNYALGMYVPRTTFYIIEILTKFGSDSTTSSKLFLSTDGTETNRNENFFFLSFRSRINHVFLQTSAIF